MLKTDLSDRSAYCVLVGESGAIDVGKLLDSQGLSAGKIFDNIVGAGEDPVLIVLCHRDDVLHKSRIAPALFHSHTELWNGERLVNKRAAQRLCQFLRDFLVIEFDGTVQRIDLGCMRLWVLQQCRNNAPLVFSGNWSMPPVRKRKFNDASFYVPTVHRIEKPFGEERRPYMS